MKNLMLIALVVSLAVGAVCVADTRYRSRQLMSEIHEIKSETDKMRLEWSQLILEAATLTNEGSVYEFAERDLKMTLPRAQNVVYRR